MDIGQPNLSERVRRVGPFATYLQLSPTLRLGDYGYKSPITLVQKDLEWLQRLFSGLLHVRSGFTSKSRRSLSAPP
jgi:hypothetical protein